MNRLLLVTSSPFVRLSDRGPGRRPRQGASRSWRERTPASHSRRTVIQMKFFHAALVMLAITALGVGQSAAQTGAPSPGGMGATSPLGADFGQTPGSSQSSTVPFAGVAIPAPCTRGGPNAAALSTFDGGALSPTSGGLSPAASFATSGTPAGLGAESSTSAPCNSVSSSGVMSAPNSAATTVLSANSYSLPSSTSSGSSAPATANGSPNIKNLGNRPRHQWSRYDGTRDDRPRLPSDPVRIGIANRDVGISGDPSRDNVFRRHGHATG
jgi:hypothetical protein